MDLNYSDEQNQLRDSVARFVREQYSFEARRKIVESPAGYSSAHWGLFAELGWLAIPVAEADGGIGGTFTDAAIMFEEFGKGIVVEPYLATVILGAGLVGELGSAAQKESILPRVVAGELQLALAFAEPGSRYEIGQCATTATRDGTDWLLDGHKAVVMNGAAAELLLVSARTTNGISVFLVDANAAGLRRSAYTTIDDARAADIHLQQARVGADALLGSEGGALAALGNTIERATLCVCAEAVGCMATLLAKTVEYTRTRKQFGVSLSSFQALQHRMAEMFIELEQARSILTMALMAAEAGEALAKPVSAAKSRIGAAARRVGQEAIQLHGGIGVTDELDVGHYFKRLTAIEMSFGSSDWHLRRYGGF